MIGKNNSNNNNNNGESKYLTGTLGSYYSQENSYQIIVDIPYDQIISVELYSNGNNGLYPYLLFDLYNKLTEQIAYVYYYNQKFYFSKYNSLTTIEKYNNTQTKITWNQLVESYLKKYYFNGEYIYYVIYQN